MTGSRIQKKDPGEAAARDCRSSAMVRMEETAAAEGAYPVSRRWKSRREDCWRPV
jgi:hypothetical protein